MLNGGGSVPVVLYPVSSTQFAVLGAATTESTSGVAFLATAGSGSISELRGNYSVNLRGVTGTTPEDVVGVLIANGGGAFTGTLDITNGGAGTALQSSSYTVTSTSANTTVKTGFANFGSIGFNMYIVDSTRVLLLENDNKGVLTGEMQVQ
jgi:hypothetical protein